MQKGKSLATSPWPKYPLTSAVLLARSSLFLLQTFAADRLCQIQRTVIKRKTLSLTIGSALHASLILSNYTVQTVTINKSILRKLNGNSGATVSLLQVDWNEENSREENFFCCTNANVPSQMQKRTPKGNRSTTDNNLRGADLPRNISFSFCLPMENTFTNSTWACKHRKAWSCSALAT